MNIDIKELLALAAPTSSTAGDPRTDHGLAIVSADRGHVWVGRVVTDGAWCAISDASTVRWWGTDAGLGQLAEGGPREKTKLDKEWGEVRVPVKAVIAIRPCKESAWKL